MEEKIYTCRTEEISGTTYRFYLYLKDETKWRLSGSYQSREEVDSYVERMMKAHPEYRIEITEHPWTNNVCIECGREEY